MTQNSLDIRIKGLSRSSDGRPRVARLREEISGRTLPDALVIWRYLSVGKFVSLLANKSLWFSRLDLLGDPFEGAATAGEIDDRNADDTLTQVWTGFRRWCVVNCWYGGVHESDAMWKLYAPNSEGFAICSTVGRLTTTLANSPKQFADTDVNIPIALPKFFIGAVEYVDHDRTHMEGVPIAKFFLKRLAFQHEREVRAVAPLPELGSEKGVDAYAQPDCHGVNVTVDLAALITEVVVCPTAPPWFIQTSQSLVAQYDAPFTLRKSILGEQPRF